MSYSATVALIYGLSGLMAAVGLAASWWLHRRTDLSPRNLYLLAAAASVAMTLGGAVYGPRGVLLALPPFAGTLAASVLGRRLRLAALGAGGELREHELSRRMAGAGGQRRNRADGPDETNRAERTYIATQGELVRERAWPEQVSALPMGADGEARLPRGEGQHLFIVGATGSGKTTSARRCLAAAALRDNAAALVLDPKGDPDLLADMRALSAHTGRPLVVFDPFDQASERWNPLWADSPAAVAERLGGALSTTEPYYADLLRNHLGAVAGALRAGGLWPATMPLLIEAAQLGSLQRLSEIARRSGQSEAIADIDAQLALAREAKRELASVSGRLRVLGSHAWRSVLSPDAEGQAVCLPDALAAGALVLWRTWAEELLEEAQITTALALSDVIAAARQRPTGRPWFLLLDEFGAVLGGEAGRFALAALQRARSVGGQVAVLTQSVADVAAIAGREQLLDSLADNFTGFVAHRQNAPDSRDWLARLFGTRELWQSTDRMRAAGSLAEGTGSRRRAREFLVRPDEFRALRVGEAVVATTHGPAPERVQIASPPELGQGAPISAVGLRGACGPTSLQPAPTRTSPEGSSRPSSAPSTPPSGIPETTSVIETQAPAEQ